MGIKTELKRIKMIYLINAKIKSVITKYSIIRQEEEFSRRLEDHFKGKEKEYEELLIRKLRDKYNSKKSQPAI